MKIIFHIGMGKTGTSSVQSALQQAGPELAAQNTAYLGLWFSLIDQKYYSYAGLAAFFDEPPEVQAKNAARLVAILTEKAAENGAETFIFSNEGLYGFAHKAKPFFDALRGLTGIALVAYMRDPHSWLPSAFTQWELHHKQSDGPLKPFGRRGRELIRIYDLMPVWLEMYQDILSVRPFEKGTDVVADFAGVLGITLTAPAERTLERAEDAEVLMRALYNNRFAKPMLPDRFDRAVLNTRRSAPIAVSDMTDLCFSMTDIDDIVAERREVFEVIRDRLGFDYLSGAGKPRKAVYDDALRDRLIDYLTEITLQQSERILRLERQIKDRGPSGD